MKKLTSRVERAGSVSTDPPLLSLRKGLIMLKERMLSYIREKDLIPSGAHVLAACSGGADSVCLLLLLWELREELEMQLTAAHVHHGLRGESADGDAVFVQELAEKLEIPCVVKWIDVRSFREEQRLSEEEAARILRYRTLREVQQEVGADLLAAAHHLDDQAETVLLNMLRGSGLRGLSGMKPKNGSLIRPLLSFTREEIVEELERRGQDWREDETNALEIYDRNVLRNRVFPALREIRPDAARKISETAELLSETEMFLSAEAEDWIRLYADTSLKADARQSADTSLETETWHSEDISQKTEIRLPVHLFLELRPVMRREVIMYVLRHLGFRMKDRTRQNIEDIAALAEKQTGKRYIIAGEGEVIREYRDLVIRRIGELREQPAYAMSARVFPYRKGMSIPSGEWENLKDFAGKECTKWFDYGKINQMPVLRTRQEGDRFSTLPGTHKKLKDYLIDEKVPRDERDRLMLVAAGPEVLWVIGMRMNECYKVTEETEEILEITVTGADDEREDQHFDI